jgi:single-strand DNA-binding protein
MSEGRRRVNKVILIGRLGRDPEIRYTGSGEGQAVCNFSLATDEGFKDKNGERQKRTEWHRVVLWGKTAENAQQILKKGSLTCIEGKIQSREYEKDGEKRTVYEVIASHFLALDPKSTTPAATGKKPNGGVPRAQIPDSDIPF